MFIRTKDTPSPNTLKFLPGITVLEEGTLEFVSKKDAESSELASLLFKLKNVVRVLFGYDFVSVSKSDDGQWDIMKPHILTSITEYFTVNNGDVISNVQGDRKDVEYDKNDSGTAEQTQEQTQEQIRTENTPNPNTLKFLPGITVLEEGTLEFVSKKDAESSELASSLFQVKNVVRVLFGYDFVSVSKSDDGQWGVMKPHILTSIAEYFTVNNGDVVSDLQGDREDVEYDKNDSDIVEQIQELIHSMVRPSIMQDGGDIEFRKYKDGIVYLQLKGSCSGCPSARITLKDGIEEMLRYYVREVESVEEVE